MSTATYMGIPRERIPWEPRIDEEACTGCGACADECPNGVYALDEAVGRMRVVAPLSCVVLCDRCAASCPNEAISFPSKDQTKRLLRRLIADGRKPA